ncbi:MAG: DUF58 domain-containing protein [Phycisphaerae bacterium]|nr:DUF58 domain-containing protein [Phycisphaerae bacterium]
MSAQATSRSTRKLTDLLDSRFMARLDGLDVASRKILQGKLQGERRSKRRGQSVEFADHRPYVRGDDLRFVDWNIYGRLEQLFMKLFMEEQDLTVHVLLDVSGSMATGEPTKDLAARRLAAALSYVSLVNNNRVTLSAFCDGLTGQMPNMRGRIYLPQMAEFLLSAEADGPSDFDKACRQATATRQGSGVMIVISDFLLKEGYENALRQLISRNYELYVVQMLSPQERSPEISGDLRLLDCEDYDVAEITLNAALMKSYKRTLAGFCNSLRDFCTARGARYLPAVSSDPVEKLVLNSLRRLGLLQ